MKKIIIPVIFFACVIIISRHIVADLKQDERIWVLEQQISKLQKESITKGNGNILKTDSKTTKTEAKQHYSIQKRSNNHRHTKVHKEKNAFDTLKFGTPIRLELNSIDSATLTKIPGIGAKSATIIIRYRDQLGGYVSPYQLADKLTWESAQERMNEWCSEWLCADTSLIRKLNVNNADFKQILRHPYISYEQTKAIVNYRDKHKRISGLEVLDMLEEFSKEDIERLKPYLEF